jgi:hypothetical protein
LKLLVPPIKQSPNANRRVGLSGTLTNDLLVGRNSVKPMLMALVISGRDFVTPDDIKMMSLPVLEHRLILRPEFEFEGLSVAEVIQQILQQIAVPR